MKKLCPALVLVISSAIFILASGPVLAQYAFQLVVPPQGAVADLVQLTSFHNIVINTGSVTDTYTVDLGTDTPPSWVVSLCEGTLCYSPLITQITFTLAPGDSTDLLVDMTPLVDSGRGIAVINLSSQGQPSLSEISSYTVLTPGLDILLVDGDGGSPYETYYQNAITALGLTYGRWDRSGFGPLTAGNLEDFPTVVWFAGDNPAAMNATDLAALNAYTLQGGDLIVSGQNLSRDFCHLGGAQYSPENRALFNNTFGGDFNVDDTNSDTVIGLSGGPVASGMTLNLSGGSGANANTSPDGLVPVQGGVAGMVYGVGNLAAVSRSYNQSRCFFMGFGFENISGAANRQTLLSDVLAWQQEGASAAPDPVPSLFATVPVASPNPFNPRTHLRFTVGGQSTVRGSVMVYDLTGRRIRELRHGSFAPGSVDVTWDGTDSRGKVVAGGLYVARIMLDGQTETLKVTLVK